MEVQDPLSGISIFLAAARAGSFTGAAERLGVTKSAVGKSISRLEKRLGFQLFLRTTRLTRLTADGEAFFAACSSASDDIVAAHLALSSGHRVLQGRLHINMPVAFGRHVLLPLLFEIAQPHPDLNFTLSFSDATSDLLQEGGDLAIRFGALKDSSHLIARHLATQQRVICASPAYLAAHGEPRSLADVSAHRCIVGSPKGPPMTWAVCENGIHKRISPPATHLLDDGSAIVEAAASGWGLCQMPTSVVRAHLERGALRSVLSGYSSPVDVHALWPRQAQLSPRLRYVVDRLVAYAAKGCLD